MYVYHIESVYQFSGHSGYTAVDAETDNGFQVSDGLLSLWSDLQAGKILWFVHKITHPDGSSDVASAGPVPTDYDRGL